MNSATKFKKNNLFITFHTVPAIILTPTNKIEKFERSFCIENRHYNSVMEKKTFDKHPENIRQSTVLE